MNALQIIYLVGATAIGFLIGTIVELFVDNAYLITVEKEKDRLKLELEEARKVKQPEVIEIVDPWAVGAKVPDEVSFPNKDGF